MRLTQGILSAFVLLGIAVFATSSLIGAHPFATSGTPTALQAVDDPVRNGMQIVERRPDGSRLQTPALESGPIYLLDKWVFTAKGKPSPYQ